MSAAGATAARRPRSAGQAIRSAVSLTPRLRRQLFGLTVLAALLTCGYLFWLRDSSLVKVESVTVTGLTTKDSQRLRSALAAAAGDMTTLHVDRASLEEVAEAFPVVRSIDVRPDFPSGIRIHVVEHRPAALLVTGSKRVPVAVDGSVLSGLPVRGELPLVRQSGAPPGRRMTRGPALSAVRVAAGLPSVLASRVEEVRRDRTRGVIVPIEDGPRVVFGSATRLNAKWAAALRVLADPDAAGADYIDVRIPERPVAGGLPVATLAPAAPAAESPAPAPAPAGAGAETPTPPDGTSPGATPGTPQAPVPATPPAPVPQPLPPQPQVNEGGGASPNTQP
jgi:cell division septal protein FtsQ